MFSTLPVRVQTRMAARADGPPAMCYYGENRSGNAGG
jgi:hypothetical protein